MRGSKVVAACIFNKLQAFSLFLAFDGASKRTDPLPVKKSTVSSDSGRSKLPSKTAGISHYQNPNIYTPEALSKLC